MIESEKPPRKGGRAKNTTLTAERKAVLALVEAEKGESPQEAVARALREKDEEVAKLKKLLQMQAEHIQEKEARINVDIPPELPRQGPQPGLPADYARYPKPGEVIAPPQIPPGGMDPIRGDLGEAFVRWFLTTNGPEETRKKYGFGTTNDRIYLLPKDVQQALK